MRIKVKRLLTPVILLYYQWEIFMQYYELRLCGSISVLDEIIYRITVIEVACEYWDCDNY